MSDVPVYDEDLYTDEAILRPYDHYAAMRELGPLVYLPRHDLYAIPRYSEVRRGGAGPAGQQELPLRSWRRRLCLAERAGCAWNADG